MDLYSRVVDGELVRLAYRWTEVHLSMIQHGPTKNLNENLRPRALEKSIDIDPQYTCFVMERVKFNIFKS